MSVAGSRTVKVDSWCWIRLVEARMDGDSEAHVLEIRLPETRHLGLMKLQSGSCDGRENEWLVAVNQSGPGMTRGKKLLEQ